jgi:DNA-binding NarL/FixJ family response regulator
MDDTDAPTLPTDLILAGSRALARGAWQEGRDYFQEAVDLEGSPEAIEGLATAAWWLDDAPAVFHYRERVYRLYRQRGDRRGAARVATGIALDHYLYRGNVAVAIGWLRSAHRLLEGTEPSAEGGWLALWEAHIALFERNDVALAKRVGAETVAIAESLGLTDLGMLGLALQGLAMVSEGQVDDGMRCLDEATTAALAGEITDLDAVVTTCCYLIYACERVRDFARAVQWCEKVEEISHRWSYRSMFGVCRCHYAAVLLWRGEWSRAEDELTLAAPELMSTRPGWVHESIVRLAELRRRQGRAEEATRLFEQALAHPHTFLGLAELALDRGDAMTATDLVDRFFRRVPPDDRTARAAGMEVAVRAWIARDSLAEARILVAELEESACVIGTAPLRAVASFASGIVAAATGELDLARRCLEDAVDLFQQQGAPFETAVARIELARILNSLDRRSAAETEARLAMGVFLDLGAGRELLRAASLADDLGIALPSMGEAASPVAPLTRREVEVLRLVARGSNNHQIADELFISVRTVERHISTIYAKIGADGTSARAIATVYAFEHGLARAL